MGATESKDAVELDFSVTASRNPFLNRLLEEFRDVQSFPADVDDAVKAASSAGAAERLANIEEHRLQAFVCDNDDQVWPQLRTALLHYYVECEELHKSVVPGTYDEHQFWRRFLCLVQQSLVKDYAVERKVAVEAVRLACRVTDEVQRKLVAGDTLGKNDKSPVTVADFASQAVIINELLKRFPTDRVVGEEDADALRKNPEMTEKVVSLINTVVSPPLSADQAFRAIDHGQYGGGPRGRHWTLDPIDGTKGYLRQEQYAVCLALIEDGEVVLGVLGCPNLPVSNEAGDGAGARGVLQIAEKGKGTVQLSLEPNSTEKPIRCAATTDITKANFTESVEAAHSNHGDAAQIAQLLGVTGAPVRMDSQCKYAAVARGDAAIYLRLPTRKGYQEKIWDHGCGFLCVTEAGGRVTDVRGNPLDFGVGRTLANNVGVVATNGVLHDEVIAAVKSVLFPRRVYELSIESKDETDVEELRKKLAAALELNVDQVSVSLTAAPGFVRGVF